MDKGSGEDKYKAGQTLVQGAAEDGGLAFLSDQGGADEYILRATNGCPEVKDLADSCSTDTEPVGGWAQGYATLNATAALWTGPGNDTHRLLVDSDKESGTWVGHRLLGAGNASGTGLAFDAGGSDTYNISESRAFGFGNHGLGVFVNAGSSTTVDSYGCNSTSCYGYGQGFTADADEILEDPATGAGLGVFFDGSGDEDSYEGTGSDGTCDTVDGAICWTNGDLGIGGDT